MKTIPIRSTPVASPDSELQRTVRRVALEHASRPGALLPILHAVQDSLGHLPAEAVPVIAEVLTLSRAEVHGVIRYYPHFRETPAGAVLLQICLAEACLARGAQALADEVQRVSGCALHEARGAFTIEPVYCLGLCASGPAVLINGRPRARITPAHVPALMGSAVRTANEVHGLAGVVHK